MITVQFVCDFMTVTHTIEYPDTDDIEVIVAQAVQFLKEQYGINFDMIADDITAFDENGEELI